MSFYLEIQVENTLHRFVMKDRDDALAQLERLQSYVGRQRFIRNDDDTRNLKITSCDGEAFIATEHIVAARIMDYDVFEAIEEQARQRRYREAREIDAEFINKLSR